MHGNATSNRIYACYVNYIVQVLIKQLVHVSLTTNQNVDSTPFAVMSNPIHSSEIHKHH